MSFAFSTFNPTDSQQAPSCSPPRTINSYWYVTDSDNRVQLVAYNQTDTLPSNVKFNVEFTGDQCIISYNDGNGETYYFMGSGNNVVYTTSVQDASSWYLYNIGSTTPVTSFKNGFVFNAKLVDENTNTYMINYIPDSSGTFFESSFLGLYDIPNGKTPSTLERGSIFCNYIFSASQVETSNYSVLDSTLPTEIDDLKFNITTIGASVARSGPLKGFGDRITIKALRSNCYDNSEKVVCKPVSDDLLFASGSKNSNPELGFDKSYNVKLTIRSKIISHGNKVDNIDSIISIYNLEENYIIVQIYGNYFLLSNEINPSHNKLKCLRKRFNSFVISVKANNQLAIPYIYPSSLKISP